MNTPLEQKRNSKPIYTLIQGVGARHKKTNISTEGGGYLDNCTYSEKQDTLSDPRMAELHLLKLPQRWIDMAAKIGVDNFLSVWKLLDEESEEHKTYIPAFSKYIKLQRDLAIKQLSHEGHNVVEIKDILKKKMNIHIERSQIYRAIR